MAESEQSDDRMKAKKRKRGGRYCVAGAPNNTSCQNGDGIPGISLHFFPKDERRAVWVKFVQRHRPGWQPTSCSLLCSAHFESECFTQRPDISLGAEGQNMKTKRWLTKTAIPTIDSVEVREKPTPSDRERRTLLRNVFTSIAQEKTPANESIDEPSIVPSDTSLGDLVDEGELSLTDSEVIEKPISSCTECASNKSKLQKLQETFRRAKNRREKQKEEVRELRRMNRVLEKELRSLQYSEGESESESESADSSDDGCSDEEEEEIFSDDGDGEDLDAEWVYQDETSDDNEEENVTRAKIKVDPESSVRDQPAFIVFYSTLLSLFSLFCFRCRTENPKVEMEKNGTMVTVIQHCHTCTGEPFKWRSQPFILGRYPAGNIMLSFAVLMAGASISKVLLVFKHMRLSAYHSRTYFYHQKKFLFPTIVRHWRSYTASLLESLKRYKSITWCGDGRYDSMGHSAKYGAYTMFCTTINKIVHFELLQANECGSSNAMELEGAKKCFTYLLPLTKITEFISDRHRGISKWIKTSHPKIKHFFDIWHITKAVVKKMLKVSKEKGCEVIAEWTRAVKNHIYWCATSTKSGFEKLILAKWQSFGRHVADEHKHHPNDLYKECQHEELEPRNWIKEGTKAHEKLHLILNRTSLLNDIKRISSVGQTDSLEGFHSTLNQWHPKMYCFSWLGTYCRHILASLHFNENLKRKTKVNKSGENYVYVTYPKFKLGSEVVREIAVPPTYGYVDEIKNLLFSLPQTDMNAITQEFEEKVPEPLNRQFPNRISKVDAMKKKAERKERVTPLFPGAEQQDSMLTSTNEKSKKRKKASKENPTGSQSEIIRKCKKCKNPMKGHPRGHCPT